ncbi:MAG: DUF3833 domain-containing protein [Gammaproteobacteria bacterium]|nr:DUF3833 domain-containing protein [Gammaproteobacteria bacterium]MCP4089271.1 DUF3833 domain-containing protein [Gammaproteobacteria bacterium]MCP4275305.1 DUF3833 domain-containing protein [Gammaproteobacteria bacterium]MCP4830911.1 DUF3833 domain-containing protein [Gammaproteobacteria bacterium]MCP4930282.1 DUF3833 domain-containing protein [Gammaproteobacteria bacterium]
MNGRTSFILFICLIFASVLSGCSSMKIEDFKSTQPEFVLEEYFEGRTMAWGLFEDRFGNVQRQFVVTMDGTWDGTTLILNEDFVYNDGETENRVWTLTKTDEFNYQGSTQNSVGIAAGTRSGNAFHWKYDFNLKVGDDTWKVTFDDWMFMQPNGVLLNKATVTRWGFKLGTVYLSFSKPAAQAAVKQTAAPELFLVANQ